MFHKFCGINYQTSVMFGICMSVFLCLSQAFQYPASVWRPAESDFKMLQGEHRKDSVLLEYCLGLHAVCGQRQESTTLFFLLEFSSLISSHCSPLLTSIRDLILTEFLFSPSTE